MLLDESDIPIVDIAGLIRTGSRSSSIDLLKRRGEMRRLKAAEIAGGTRRRHRARETTRRGQVSPAGTGPHAGAPLATAGAPLAAAPLGVVERHG